MGAVASGGFETAAADPTATTLLTHGLHGGFEVSDSANVSFVNLQLDYARLPYTYGRATHVGTNDFTLEIDASV